MSDDQNKTTSYPFYDHHTMLLEGFSFPNHSNFDPFIYNHQQQTLQNPTESDRLPSQVSFSSFLQGATDTSDGGGDIPVTTNSSVSFSSQEGGVEEDSSKSDKDVQTRVCEEGDGKSKNVRAKEKEEKKKKQERFAFMTKSEVDNLEDGYRWRKYGQKAVKNSSFPRSYYRCTNQKCSVKKRIERSYQDPTVVITTYEGQHNHHSPTVIRGSAAAMLAPAFSNDMFFPSRNQRNHINPTTFYTQLTDSNHHCQQSEIHDQNSLLMPGATPPSLRSSTNRSHE